MIAAVYQAEFVRATPANPPAFTGSTMASGTFDEFQVFNHSVNDELPVFWLAVGAEDTEDVGAAQYFRQVLQTRMVNVPLVVVPGGGHQASVWRAALGPMLSWMTPQLAGVAKQADATAARKAHHGKPRPPHAAAATSKP